MDSLYSVICLIRTYLLTFFDHKRFTFEMTEKDAADSRFHDTIIRAKRGDNVDGLFRIRKTDNSVTIYTLIIGASTNAQNIKNSGSYVSNDRSLPLLHLANALCQCWDGRELPSSLGEELTSHPWIKKWCSNEAIGYWLRDAHIPPPSNNPSNIILLVGPSGCGKSTIEKELVNKGLKSIKSYTTRKPRYDGEDAHIFLDRFVFEKGVDLAGGIDIFKESCVAYTYYNGEHYYATQEQADDADIYVIDPAGVEWFKSHYKGEKNIKVVYIYASEPVRYARMATSRGEEAAKQRLTYDRQIFAPNKFNMTGQIFYVDNEKNTAEELDAAVERIYKIWKGDNYELPKA